MGGTRSGSCGDGRLQDLELARAGGTEARTDAQGQGQHRPRRVADGGAPDQWHAKLAQDALANFPHGWPAGDRWLAFREFAKDYSDRKASCRERVWISMGGEA